MKQYLINLKLKEEEEMIFFNEKNEPSITYMGYNYMNNIVNASVHMPDTILIDGNIKENPYIVSNDQGILEITASAIAFCKFNGSIVSASATVRYNTEIAFTNELVNIVATNKSAGDIIKNSSSEESDEYIIRKINDSLSLKANIRNDKVVKAIAEYTSDKTNGERKIISIAQRNALKKLPPFSTPIRNIIGMEGSRVGEVTLTLYGDDDNDKIIDILAIAKNINANVMSVDLINIESGEITEVSDLEKSDYSPQNQNQPPEATNTEKKVVVTEDYGAEKTIRNALIERYKKLPKDVFNKAKELLYPGNINLKDMSNDNIELILKCAESLVQ